MEAKSKYTKTEILALVKSLLLTIAIIFTVLYSVWWFSGVADIYDQYTQSKFRVVHRAGGYLIINPVGEILARIYDVDVNEFDSLMQSNIKQDTNSSILNFEVESYSGKYYTQPTYEERYGYYTDSSGNKVDMKWYESVGNRYYVALWENDKPAYWIETKLTYDDFITLTNYFR